jgi:hypothetical protein
MPTSALDGVSVPHEALVTLFPGKSRSTGCTGGWVGPMVCLDGCGEEKIFCIPRLIGHLQSTGGSERTGRRLFLSTIV